MELKIIKHGLKYYKDKGARCPECQSLDIKLYDYEVAQYGGTYLKCWTCDCVFEFIEEKSKPLGNGVTFS